MWQTKVIDIQKKDGNATICVEFSNGEEKIVKYFPVPMSDDHELWLARVIKSEINRMNGVYAVENKIVKGNFKSEEVISDRISKGLYEEK